MALEKRCPLLDDLEDAIACQVCFQRMEKPKTLKCLHSFCLTCLVEISPTDSGLLPCPICRVNTMVPEMDPRMLPTAFLINQISDIVEKHEKMTYRKETTFKYGEVSACKNNYACICDSMQDQRDSATAYNTDDNIPLLKEAQRQNGPDTTAKNTISFEVDENAAHRRYNVKLQKTSLCSKKEHTFVAKGIEKEYKEGDKIKLKLWKFCEKNSTPCCAWADKVNATMVDSIGRGSDFCSKRVAEGGWELSGRANHTGVFRVIIKVNKKAVESIPLEVKAS